MSMVYHGQKISDLQIIVLCIILTYKLRDVCELRFIYSTKQAKCRSLQHNENYFFKKIFEVFSDTSISII